jgi:hypothetical protein
MKKIYLLAITSLIGMTVNAQNFVYSTVQHIDEVMVNTFEIYDIKFTTPTPEDITFMWERVSDSFLAEWDYSLCDYTGCYVGVPTTGAMTPITMAEASNGTEGFFKMNIGHQGYNGDGLVEIYVYDSNDYNRGDTVSFHLSISELSINEVSQNNSVVVSPNPATNLVTISGSTAISVSIFNGIGLHVMNLEGNGNGSFDVSNLESGVYFLNFENEVNENFTKRLIIQ